MSKKRSQELVCLEGSPRTVGKTFGRVNMRDVAADVRLFYSTVQVEEKISPRKGCGYHM